MSNIPPTDCSLTDEYSMSGRAVPDSNSCTSTVYLCRLKLDSQFLENQLQEAHTQQPQHQSLEGVAPDAGSAPQTSANGPVPGPGACSAPSPGRNWKPLELKRRISEHARLIRTSFSLVGTPNYIGVFINIKMCMSDLCEYMITYVLYCTINRNIRSTILVYCVYV